MNLSVTLLLVDSAFAVWFETPGTLCWLVRKPQCRSVESSHVIVGLIGCTVWENRLWNREPKRTRKFHFTCLLMSLSFIRFYHTQQFWDFTPARPLAATWRSSHVSAVQLPLFLGLALDLVNQTLFWADAQNDRIEMIFLNGTGRKVLLSGEIPHIFGLRYNSVREDWKIAVQNI